MRPENMGNAFIAHSQDFQDSSQLSSVSVESQNFYARTDDKISKTFSQIHQFAIVSISGTASSTNGMTAIGVVANGGSATITGYYLQETSIHCEVRYSGRTLSFTNIDRDGGGLSISVLGIG